MSENSMQLSFRRLASAASLVASLLAVLFAPAALHAQDFRASITGRVVDASGGVLPGVTLTAVNTSTNVSTVATTSDDGSYSILSLTPGPYTLTAELSGFKKMVRELTLETQARPVVDFTLEPGAVEEVVTVQAETPLLELGNASRGEVITGRVLVDMPLNGRNAFALTALVPGAGFTGRGQATTFLRTTANGGFSSVSLSGGRPRNNEALLDGVPNTGSDGVIQYVPSVDAAAEFKVQTNSFDAEFGRFLGGVINATSRSGSNEIHGTAFDFIRNSRFNARDFFAADKPEFNYNLFGGSIGGPLTVPGLYKGTNRTFFFFNYEGSREDVPRAFVSTVPTEAQRNGDFSQTSVRLTNGTAAPVTIYDPLTTRREGAAFVRDAFPGNRIPAERINPIARQLMNLYPLPNTAGDPITGANNYQLSFKDPLVDNGVLLRVDHRFSDRHQLFARYSWRRFDLARQGAFQNAVTGDTEIRDVPGLALDDTFMIKSNLLLNVRYGYTGYNVLAQADAPPIDQLALGFPASLVDQLPVNALPQLTIAGYTTLGGANKYNEVYEGLHTVRASLTNVRGRQTWKAGFEMRQFASEIDSRGAGAAGTYAFDSVFTRGPNPQTATQVGGQALASFLLGYGAGSGSVVNNAISNEHASYYGFFLQNDWRVTDRLTVNMGLRYDWEGPYTAEGNRLNRGFAFDQLSPIDAAARANYARAPIPELPASAFTVRGGRLFAGVDGVPEALTDLDRNNIAPRIGMAYSIGPKTVVRAGYGLFYGATTLGTETRDGFSVTTPWVTSQDGQLTPFTTLSNPYPNGLQQPAGSSLGLMTSVGQSITFVDPNRVTPYAHQFQVSLQRELPWSTLVDVAYAGSRGRRLPLESHQINAIPADVYASARDTFVATGRNVLNDSVTNPFSGLITTGSLTGATTTRGQLLRPYPQFTGVAVIGESRGSSQYDAIQVKVTRRFSDGFSVLAAYTGSRSTERMRFLNDQDTELVEEPNEFDVPHNLTLSGTYELPFGPGRALFGGTSGLAGRLIGGWQVNAIYTISSGIPLTFSGAELIDGADPSLPSSERSVARWFDTAAFRQLQTLELIRTSRLSSVRAPGRNNVDLSLFKTTTLTGNVRLQFRLEAFNAFNHPEFSAPNTTFGNPNFGRITTLNTFTRQIQLGFKLLW
jgi:Carboxypeptidase regulatory-like domain/TonB dependent receptor